MECQTDQIFCTLALAKKRGGFCQNVGQHEEDHIYPVLLVRLL